MFSLLIDPSVAHVAWCRIRTGHKVGHLMAVSLIPFFLVLRLYKILLQWLKRLVCVAVFVRSEAMQARTVVHQDVMQLRSSCILLRWKTKATLRVLQHSDCLQTAARLLGIIDPELAVILKGIWCLECGFKKVWSLYFIVLPPDLCQIELNLIKLAEDAVNLPFLPLIQNLSFWLFRALKKDKIPGQVNRLKLVDNDGRSVLSWLCFLVGWLALDLFLTHSFDLEFLMLALRATVPTRVSLALACRLNCTLKLELLA